MLRMLDLIYTILKYCCLLAALRLLVTAFNWEFGLSRRYLRLLELLFCASQGAPAAGPTESGANETCHRLSAQRSARRVSSPNGPPVFLLDEPLDAAPLNGSSPEAASTAEHEFQLADASLLVRKGVAALIDDQVTKRFSREQLQSWNLLTRTTASHRQHRKWAQAQAPAPPEPPLGRWNAALWALGLIVRYALLLPLRLLFTLAGFLWITGSMSLVGLIPRQPKALSRLKRSLYRLVSLMGFRMLACGITSRLHFHNRQHRARHGDICVANHTSPIDVVLLACDNCYALVGQRHGGLLGALERALSRATNHVWFDRAEMRDRQLVGERLREHIAARNNLPVLIFPEGTCINNSAVMMFRKGSFEISDRVHPVAIKYDARFGDPFWNSSKHSYAQYLLLMMSSWAIKCDVWYLAPMDRKPGELPAEFAQRVKAEIARQGGLVDLAWDGQLKRSAAKELWRHQQQEDYARHLRLE